MNEQIREKEVRLISATGEQLGIVPSFKAKEMAYAQNLDLVMISPSAVPPVCKIMDYGKHKYEQSKKAKDAKKLTKTNEMREVWLSMTIDKHDLETKARHARKFLLNGDKVRAIIRMRGRQITHSNLGIKVMEDFFTMLEDVAAIERPAGTEFRNIIMILT
ncbi:MAG: translation initiation factor IF-3, partial [Firmicutes bacterium]|nr:translation initiation factor IF-3 [Bacillota bacterium]